MFRFAVPFEMKEEKLNKFTFDDKQSLQHSLRQLCVYNPTEIFFSAS